MNLFKNKKISIVLHYSGNSPYGDEGFKNIITSINAQNVKPLEILVIKEHQEDSLPLKNVNTRDLGGDFDSLAQALKKAVDSSRGDYLVYIDNRQSEVILKKSYTEIVLMTLERIPAAGMIYADYELESAGQISEPHLLKHHQGRTRDNQDYGKVFFFPKAILAAKGIIDESVKYKTQFDIRLKISENNDLIHIANRYFGSLYRVIAPGTKTNVFDYLMDSKESQLEAEKVVTEHLKRIGAYLAPGDHYQERPEKESQLMASVIIPVNSRPEFIELALDSIMNQTIKDIEAIVVVNGGDDDPTCPAVKKFMPGGEKYKEDNPDVRLLVTDINNIGLCLNLGAKAARGKYYVQLDSDDRLKPDTVEKVIKKFQSDKTIGMVIGSYEMWELKESGEYNRIKDMPVVTHDEWTEDNGRNNLLRINGAGAPRCIPFSVIEEVGFFDMNDIPYARNYGEDYDMVMRISEKYKVGRIFDPIYEVVRHSGGTDHAIDQLTINRNDEAKDYMRLKGIERRIKLNGET